MLTEQPMMVDFFAGELGWTLAFVERGWRVIAIDLKPPTEIPEGCDFIQADMLDISLHPGGGMIGVPTGTASCRWLRPHFICASSPCEEFSVWGMPCFFPKRKYPLNGIRLFNHTRAICEISGIPYVLENVRAAEKFVGPATHHAGAFHLWGTGVPPLMPQGIVKGFKHGGIRKPDWPHDKRGAAKAAKIPIELSSCVAEYAERICEASVK